MGHPIPLCRLRGSRLLGLSALPPCYRRALLLPCRAAPATRLSPPSPPQAAASYLEALQALQPPLTPLSSFEGAAPLVPESPTYAVLSERRREQIFTAYVTALDKAERAARSKAQTAFQVGG